MSDTIDTSPDAVRALVSNVQGTVTPECQCALCVHTRLAAATLTALMERCEKAEAMSAQDAELRSNAVRRETQTRARLEACEADAVEARNQMVSANYRLEDAMQDLTAAQARVAELEDAQAHSIVMDQENDRLSSDLLNHRIILAESKAREKTLREAAGNVLSAFTPEHLDAVSGTKCGTALRAAIAGSAQPAELKEHTP